MGKDFGLTRPASTSTKARVAFLSASGRAANTGSIAPGPKSFRRAMAFWVSGLAGSVQDLISVISLSARKLVKKLIQPFRKGTPAPLPRARSSSTPISRDISAQAQTHPTRQDAPRGPPVGNVAELCHRPGSGRRSRITSAHATGARETLYNRRLAPSIALQSPYARRLHAERCKERPRGLRRSIPRGDP